MEQYAKELMKKATKPKEYAQVVTQGNDDIFAIDLAEMGEWGDSNSGYKMILVVVDCFSRYMWALPLRTKKADETWNAIAPILEEHKPRKLWCDQGGEFYNKVWDSHLKKLGIVRYSTYGEHKASIAERAIRTLKTKLWYHFIKDNTRNWMGVLKSEVEEYNRSKHSTIGVSPLRASHLDDDAEAKLWGQLYQQPDEGKPKYKLGQWVRISRVKGIFEKGFHPNWSYEVYKIVGRKLTKPVMYQLQDYYGEPITGSFYEEEVQPVKNPDYFPIEKVIKKNKDKALVKLMGYTNPVWLPADQVGALQ